MRSIKKTILVVNIIIVSIITLIIITNIQISNSTKHINDNKLIMYELSEYINELDAPIRVFAEISKNILDNPENQVQFESTILIKSEKLKESFKQIKYILNSIKFLEQKLCIFEILKNENTFFVLQMNSKYDLISEIEEQLTQVIRNDTFIFSNNIVNIKNLYTQILTEDKNNHKAYIEYSTRISMVYTKALNYLFFILILMIILMTNLVLYLLKTDFESIIRTYDQIRLRKYDIDKVMRKEPYFIEEKEIYYCVRKLFNEQKISLEFKKLLSDNYIIEDILDSFFLQTNKLLGIERVGILFIDPIAKTMTAEYAVATYDELYVNIGYSVNINSSSLKEVILTKKNAICNNLTQLYKEKPNSESLKLITKEGIKSNICIPLISNSNVFGLIFLSSKQVNHFSKEISELLNNIVSEISEILNHAYLMKVFLSNITMSFARLVDKKDNETGDHILRMVKYSSIIAQGVHNLNLKSHVITKKDIIAIERNASAHDIGKVAIMDDILKKPGQLTTDEFEIMKSHTTIGADIFKELNKSLNLFNSEGFYVIAEDIARYHHEKWNGTGYPHGLKGDAIPIAARIVALADVFDALTSERIYKEAFSIEKALKIIDESCGSHFDPVIVDAFKQEFELIRNVYFQSRKC